MTTNEHLDMSGNPSDQPYICDECGKEIKEENLHGTDLDDEKFLCSSECAGEWEDKQGEPLDTE